jgi:hypothetical protein
MILKGFLMASLLSREVNQIMSIIDISERLKAVARRL